MAEHDCRCWAIEQHEQDRLDAQRLREQLETARKALERIPELPHASAMRVEALDTLRAIAKIGEGQK